MKIEQLTQVLVKTAPVTVPSVDPLKALREVLDLEQESKPTLDVEQILRFAVDNPDTEIVDSLGAVSVVCVLYGAYGPKNLIPQHLLTHKNFSTLGGLRRVVTELNMRRGKQ